MATPGHSVLHVLNTYRSELGGGGEHLLRLTRGLAACGFRSAVAVGSDGPIAAQLRDAGLTVVALGPMGLSASLRLAALFRTVRPDLVHLHGSRAGLLGTLAVRLSATHPVIYTAHVFAFRRQVAAPRRWMLARMEAITCQQADRVICLTQGDMDAAARHGIPMTRATVIPNGVDVARFDTGDDRRRELGMAAGVPVVGLVARLVPQKDPLAFVALAQRVSEAEPEARFLLVGDGPLRPALEQEIRHRGLQQRIVITGFRQDVPALLRTMDVVVLMSRWEGLPFVILEAMAAGRPVVATLLPGTAEAIKDGETGHLIPAGDLPRFVGAVVQLLRHPREREEMGRRARERVARDFSLSRMIDATAEVYAAALASASFRRR